MCTKERTPSRIDRAIIAQRPQKMRASGVPRWCGGHHPVGDAESGAIRLSFNPQLRVEFRGATVTSDAGLLLPRELDESLGLSALIERHLSDPRTGRNTQFPVADLVRQSIYSRLAGYEDTNDAERLAEDPTFRMLASRAPRNKRRAHVHTALVRDGCPGGGTELPRTDARERGPDPTRGGAIAQPTRDARHRQLREPRPRHAGAVRVQRALRVRLLSPALRVQPRGRLPRRETPTGQCP